MRGFKRGSPMTARERKRHGRFNPATHGARAGAIQRRRAQARQLKRKHGHSVSDPRRFRKILGLAQSTVFRQKPGPKPDRQAAHRISRAERQRARGVKWPELYERFLPGWKELNAITRADAEDGFRRKVNKHRQRHQRMGERS